MTTHDAGESRPRRCRCCGDREPRPGAYLCPTCLHECTIEGCVIGPREPFAPFAAAPVSGSDEAVS